MITFHSVDRPGSILVVLAMMLVPIALAPMRVAAQSSSPPSTAQTPQATRELDVEGIVAEVIESDRKDNVLTVRVRFRNTGNSPQKLQLVGNTGYVDTYVIAGDTKYPLYEDANGQQLATPRDGGGWLEPTIKPKASFTWWGKFPAPPAARKSYTLHLKVGPPIENVPIVDRP